MAPTLFPAFKEWAPIVAALGRGDQVLILRKGGIAEGKGGFQARHARFWLFPSQFHPAPGKLRPDLPVSAPRAETDPIPLRYFAEVTDHQFLSDFAAVAKLAPFHGWAAEAVAERFAWACPPGLHVFIVRVWAAPEAVLLPPSPLWGGCKSWLDVPASFTDLGATPVLDEAAFAAKVRQLPLVPAPGL